MSAQARTADVGKVEPRIHKATPAGDRCGICGQRIKTVPGGQGLTWVHSDSGAVVAHDPPLAVAELLADNARMRAALSAHDELVAALNRLLFCPALNLDDLEEEDLAAADQARAALRKVSS